jgi:hypothetical protein
MACKTGMDGAKKVDRKPTKVGGKKQRIQKPIPKITPRRKKV